MISTSSPDILYITSPQPERQFLLFDEIPLQLCKSAAVSTGRAVFSIGPQQTSSKCPNVQNTPAKSSAPSVASVSEKSGVVIRSICAPNVVEHRPQFLPYCTSAEASSDSLLVSTTNTGFWHWLIVFGSFLCLFIVEGLCFSYGLHMQAMIVEDQFSLGDVSTDGNNLRPSLAALSFPGSIMCGTYLLLGPLTGALASRFNDRLIAGLGAAISALSILLSGLFARNLSSFTLLFGFFGGVGCGLIYVPAITVVGQWFDRHRALIVGIVMCGGGFGAALLAIAIRPLCRAFTWRGALIITSALFVQTLLGIALLRPFCTHQSILAIHCEHNPSTGFCHKRAKTQSDTDKKWSFPRKPANRRNALKCGSIMRRIIEEKNRQRTTSTGSLDGMVITRENEVIALSSAAAYESVAIAAAAYASTHPVQDLSYLVSPTSHPEPGTDEPIENTTRCAHATGFPERNALRTLQEESCSPAISNQQSCVAVLPPPVRFNRNAVRRIARALIHKLQLARVLPRHPSFTVDLGPSRRTIPYFRHSISGRNEWHSTLEKSRDHLALSEQGSRLYDVPEIGRQRSHIPDFRHKTILHFSAPTNTVVDLNRWTTDRTVAVSTLRHNPVDSPHMLSGLTSSVSLDPCLNGLIVQELHELPLDEQTKASVLTALRIELCRPKCRPSLFYQGFPASGVKGQTRLPMKAINPHESGCGHFHVTYKTKSGSVQRTARYSPTLMRERSGNSADEAPLVKRTPVLLESASLVGTPVSADGEMFDILSYLCDMLNFEILKSGTFLILLLACSINMLVLLVPYYYLPLLLEFGGYECNENKLWCPDGLPHRTNLRPSWLHHATRWIAGEDSATFFVSPGSVLLSIGLANLVGRMFAALYMERSARTKCQLYKSCFFTTDPIGLTILCLLLCGLSLAGLPLSIHGLITSTPRQERDIPREIEHVQAWSIEFRLILIYVSSVMYGGASATALSLRSVVLVELFGIRRLTNAFGYLLIFQGFCVICGPPIFGSFCDLTCRGQFLPDSYSEIPSDIKSSRNLACANRLCTMFYICAALFVLTGLLFIPLRWFARRESNCCPSTFGVAASSFHTPKETIGEEGFSTFPSSIPDFPNNNDTRDTQTTTVSAGCTDSGD